MQEKSAAKAKAMASLEQLKDQSMNRRTYDGCKTSDDLRVTTGPGRYQLDVPPQACDACFAPEPTVRQQRWGAALNQGYMKTDVESDLLNINRPTTRTVCDQYNPDNNKVNAAAKESAKECSFPQTFSRLVDPPCNNRSVGWNRFEWLCDNPQAAVMLPFDNMVTTRLQKKDQHRPCIPVPQKPDALLPAPLSYETNALWDEDTDYVKGEAAAAATAFREFNPAQGIATLGPSASYGGYENELLAAGPF